jgi:Bacteriophage head to tail connecting protein
LNSMDRMLGTIVNLSSIAPTVIDKLDSDGWVDKYSYILGIDPDLILANDKVALIRTQRAKINAAQQQAAAAPEMAKAAKSLGDTNVQNASNAVNAIRSIGGNV